MINLDKELERLGITVITAYGMDKDGLYLPDTKIIFINEELDGIDRKNAILHELGHLTLDHEKLECEASSVANKRETQADTYMIGARVAEYLSEFDNQPETVNVENFLSVYHLRPRYYDLASRLIHDQLDPNRL